MFGAAVSLFFSDGRHVLEFCFFSNLNLWSTPSRYGAGIDVFCFFSDLDSFWAFIFEVNLTNRADQIRAPPGEAKHS
jgi:hypothetical protein